MPPRSLLRPLRTIVDTHLSFDNVTLFFLSISMSQFLPLLRTQWHTYCDTDTSLLWLHAGLSSLVLSGCCESQGTTVDHRDRCRWRHTLVLLSAASGGLVVVNCVDSCRALSCPVVSCRVLSCPVVSCRVPSRPVVYGVAEDVVW